MKTCLLFVLLLSLNFSFAQQQPTIFQKGIVSNDAVFGFTLSPMAGHALWVQSNNGRRDTLFIWEADIKNNRVVNKRVASFSKEAAAGKWKDIDPMFSPDGNYIYFQSTRPVPGKPNRKGFDIWAIKKKKNGKWSNAFHLGETVNSDSSESFSSVASNGNMYYTLNHNGSTDIYMSRFANGIYQTPVALPAFINYPGERESNPFIAADESYLIYFSTDKTGLGEVDLYISYNKNGEWQQPVNLGASVNSPIAEFCPFYHTAQKRLYFARQQKLSSGIMIENIYSVDINIDQWKN